MNWIEIALLLTTGTLAGVINAVVGSGSLVTFPTLVALGYPPVLANVTNNIGVLPGSVSAAIAYRRQLAGQWRTVLPLAAFSAAGGAIGAVLLLILPAAAFDAVVPVLILLACVLVLIGPALKKRIDARKPDRNSSMTSASGLVIGHNPTALSYSAAGIVDAANQDEIRYEQVADTRRTRGLITTVGLTGIYGGYFGAAQGVILLSMLMLLVRGGIQRANAYKNVFAATANGAAAVVFVFTTPVAWLAALLVVIGAIVGGQLGGRVGRLIPEIVYRIIIVIIGFAAIVYFYAT